MQKDGKFRFPVSPPKGGIEVTSLKKSLSGLTAAFSSFFDGRADTPTGENEAPAIDAAIEKAPPIAGTTMVQNLPETALAALQCLPVPVLVLDASKTVILANDAIRRLLGLDALDGPADADDSTQHLKKHLIGQSVSQIGIDLLQDEQSVWVNWDAFLEALVKKDAIELADAEASRRNGAGTGAGTFSTSVDVVISSQFINLKAMPQDTSTCQPFHQMQARLDISLWEFENTPHFTLSFANMVPFYERSTRRKSTKSEELTSAPSDNLQSSQSMQVPEEPADSSFPASTSPPLSQIFPFLSTTSTPGNLFSCQVVPVTSPLFERIVRMKDAILDAMELPVFTMWKDSSLTFPNRAARELLEQTCDPTSKEGYDLASRLKVYTADFKRRLEPQEFPLNDLCRLGKTFKNWKVGIYHGSTGTRLNYDMSGEGIYDEKTGEFLAGIVVMKDVTEYTHKLADQNAENEHQFQLICGSLPQMLWTAPEDGMCDYLSDQWYSYTGSTPYESLGLGWLNYVHPDESSNMETAYMKAIHTGTPFNFEFRCRRNDGTWRWHLCRGHPFKDSRTKKIIKWFGFATDIHDVSEARVAAKRTKERLQSVISHAKVTVWAVDQSRKLTFLEGQLLWRCDNNANDGAIGKRVYDVFGHKEGAEDVYLFKQEIEQILNGDPTEQTSEHHIDGHNQWFRTRMVPIFRRDSKNHLAESVVEGVVGISMDVTELKQKEQENIRLLTNEAAAKEASRMKSQFLANMSHEIRTPIAGVIGMAEILNDTKLDSKQKEYAQDIQRSANGLLTVINDILDFSKIESGRLDIEDVQFNLSIVIADVNKMLSFAATRKHLQFEKDVRIGDDLILQGDPGRLRQILTNLLTNSIKFTAGGFVKLAVMVQKETEETIEVNFVIEDTGIGIDKEVQSKLFQPFSQADSSTARRFGGTGLGLTICKNLVSLMHGEISLESRAGTGTRASFWIPFHRPAFHGPGAPNTDWSFIPERLQAELSVSCNGVNLFAGNHDCKKFHDHSMSTSSQEPVADTDKQNIQILIVEDNEINQKIALKTIAKLGFSARAVWNGQEALDYLVKTPSHEYPRPDIILMDVQMPVLDGYRATHMLRHHEPYKDMPGLREIPIVAMTASAIQGDREKCERAGMDDYLSKPVRPRTLEKMLIKWLCDLKKKRPVRVATAHSEHDSNCPDGEAHNLVKTESSKPTPLTKVDSLASDDTLQGFGRKRNSGVLSIRTAAECAIKFGELESVTTNDDDRVSEFNNLDEAQEHASTLRDEKLIAASDKGDGHQGGSGYVLTDYRMETTTSDDGGIAGQLQPNRAPLTLENMKTFINEQDSRDRSSRGLPSSEDTICEACKRAGKSTSGCALHAQQQQCRDSNNSSRQGVLASWTSISLVDACETRLETASTKGTHSVENTSLADKHVRRYGKSWPDN